MQADNTLQRLRAGELIGATRLDLSANLTSIPDEVFALADTLEVLNLSNNHLTDLPNALRQLTKLKVIFCSNNPFTHVPEILGELPQLSMVGFKACNINTLSPKALPVNLRWLILTDNALTSIPEAIGDSKYLQKCMLAGNKLTELPASMQACTNLELLRISANQFKTLPDWLLTMPKLSWVALAGNPLSIAHEKHAITNNTLPNIAWDSLTIHQQLGEGASGMIYQATWQVDATHTKQVAVKVFKGAVTSDGLPESEMAAFIAAGAHPNLTTVEGIVSGHPEGTQGIVMALIDPSFTVLANPPSLSSCTRDVYDNACYLSMAESIKMALNIASATAQLHAHGMIHGDLYAHNILHTPQADALLSDFGGASFLPDNQALSTNIQKIEVRAFGCLLEELIMHCSDQHDHHHLVPLSQLRDRCLWPTVADRPRMREVVEQLAALIS
jgi:hypothetical protein